MTDNRQNTLLSDLLLLLVALIWGFGFVAQRAGMNHIGPYTFNGIRFLLGSLCLIPLVLRTGTRPVLLPYGKGSNTLLAGGLAGLALFAGASLQQMGLQYTTAGKAGFITGLYVIIVPLLGLFLRQRTGTGTWIGGCAATIGLYLLSVQDDFSIAFGDLLELFGAIFWAVHVLLLGYFSPRTIAIRLALIQFLICALLSLLTAACIETFSLAGIRDAALPLAYGGICSVGAGYTLQVMVQRKAHPAHAAILLSLESAFAALGGWLILQETLTPRALLGCLLMLLGMIFSQLWPMIQSKKAST